MFKRLMNNKGELDLNKDVYTPDEVKEIISKQVDSLVQPKIDSIVTERLSRQAQKFGDYEDLKKFKVEHETKIQQDQQKQLEEQGKYEEAMKAHNAKLEELSGVISQKDNAINSMKINNALTSAVVANGGYLEETLAMLKSSAELKDGNVVILAKDENGIEKNLSVSEGVKSFLEKRPHLVKANVNTGGGDSGGGTGGGSAGNEGVDLVSLQELVQKQTLANDHKGVAETRAKIKAQMIAEGRTISSGVY